MARLLSYSTGAKQKSDKAVAERLDKARRAISPARKAAKREWEREKQAEARINGMCTTCFKRRARSKRKTCQHCNDVTTAWRKIHDPECKIQQTYNKNRRDVVLNAYGHKCACCGESRREFLAVDHVHGGGNKERKELGLQSSLMFYKHIIVSGFPDKYRLLCHNCNLSRGFYGYCPHETESKESLNPPQQITPANCHVM